MSSAQPVHKAPKKSRAEAQMQTVMLIATAMQSRDADKLAAAYSHNARLTIYGGIGELHGSRGVAAEQQKYFDAFTDTKFGVSRVWERGSTWAVEWAFSGTQAATFLGVPAKTPGAPVGVAGMSILWFDETGHVVKEHRYFDTMTIHDQLLGRASVRPPPAAIPDGPPETHVSKSTFDEQAQVDATKAIYAAIDARRESDYMALFADDAVLDNSSFAVKMTGAPAIKEHLAAVAKAFPDMQHHSPTLFGADGFVVNEWTLSGTHSGATNPKVELHGVDLLTWKNGKLETASTYTSAKELLDQVAAPPKP